MNNQESSNVNKKIQINSAVELANLIKENVYVVIKISASWCGPCKNEKFLNNYNKLKNNYISINSIKFIEFDVDLHLDIIKDKKYYDIEISSVPTFIVTKNGHFTRKFEGCNHLQQINEYLYNNINE